MAKKIITTVGASIFSNYQSPEVRTRRGRDYWSIDTELARTRYKDDGSDVPASDIYRDEYRVYVREIKKAIQSDWYAYPDPSRPNTGASAEISSILKIAEREEEPCEVYLIATDTLQSVLAAELIAEWFEKFPQPKVSKVLFRRPPEKFDTQDDSDHVVKSLRVRSAEEYEKGFLHLFELLNRVTEKDGSENIIFNITGGYKALVPVLTLYAQVRKIPLCYLFEEREEQDAHLIPLDPLPLYYDWGALELLEDYIKTIKKLAEEPNNKAIDLLRQYRIIEKDSHRLTIIGNLAKEALVKKEGEEKTHLGYMAEYKVYEALIEDFDEIPKHSVTYWWDKSNPSVYSDKPLYGRDKEKEEPIEFDLISEKDGKQIWYEVKAFSDSGIDKAAEQIRKRLDFQNQALKAPLDRFRIVFYKLDFETIEAKKRELEKIKKIFDGTGIAFEIYYFDIPVKGLKRNITEFLKQKIKLEKVEFPL